MIKKRLIANIICYNGNVVQSFKYKNFLPIGRVESSVKNLNRWNADEILILSIDRSINKAGPDFDLLNRIRNLDIETPIIYGGGISSLLDAKKVLEIGADRIVIESLADDNIDELKKISENIGSQSIILSMPLSCTKNNELRIYDYKIKKEKQISKNFIKAINENLVSEILITDYKSQGTMKGFNQKILKKLIFKKNLILSGGIYDKNSFTKIFKDKRVVASAIGNNLNYGEHRIERFKSSLNLPFFRKAYYSKKI